MGGGLWGGGCGEGGVLRMMYRTYLSYTSERCLAIGLQKVSLPFLSNTRGDGDGTPSPPQEVPLEHGAAPSPPLFCQGVFLFPVPEIFL